MAQHGACQRRCRKEQPAYVCAVCSTRLTIALQPLFDRSADASVDDGLLDELPEQRILLRDSRNGLPQELPCFLGWCVMTHKHPQDVVILLGQRRIELEGADTVSQLKEIRDLHYIKLHRSRGGQPETGCFGGDVLTDSWPDP